MIETMKKGSKKTDVSLKEGSDVITSMREDCDGKCEEWTGMGDH